MEAVHEVRAESGRTRFGESSIEFAMLAALQRHLGVELAPAVITVDDETRFEVEAADADRTVFAQLIANTGEFKSAHRNRVSANLFKLAWVRRSLYPGSRHILCVTPSVVPALIPSGWVALATRDFGIDVLVVDPDTSAVHVHLDASAP